MAGPGAWDMALRVLLAFTVASACVGVLRRPWRRVFGAGSTYPLWLAVPLSLSVAAAPVQAPWAVVTMATRLHDAAEPLAASATHGAEGHAATGWIIGAWLAGIACVVLRMAVAQWRYGAAVRRAQALSAYEGIAVLRAHGTGFGPAQVGLFPPRIVLPTDFSTRFTAEEQRLVLAHEAVHARRRDAAWAALGEIVTAILWFHPLAWWSLRAFRTDQELACDAAVIARHPSARRTYAEALLKNHDVLPLPIGCSWYTTHPLTERITMLSTLPSRTRRRIAWLCMPLALSAVVASAWSSTPTAGAGKPQFQIDANVVASDGNDAHVTVCANEGAPATISPVTRNGQAAWTIRFSVTPAPQPGMLDVAVESSSDHDHHLIQSRQLLRGKPNERMLVRFGNGADSGLRQISIVPAHGCEAAKRAHA